MTTRSQIALVALLAITGLLPSRAGDQPNIIILLADDLGYGELGCQGNPEIPTPSIDSIATNGIRFTQAYVTAPNCSPSRAGLLTGRIPTRFGYEFNPIGARNEDPGVGLPPSQTTLAEMLHDAGYATGLVGKWHLGGTPDYHPQRQGFDEFFGFMHEGHYFVPPPGHGVTSMLRRKSLPGGARGRWTSPSGSLVLSTHMGHNEPQYDTDNPIIRSSQPVAEPAYLTDAFTREAIDFIGRHAARPFFLLVAYNAVHSPLQGAERYIKKFEQIPDIHRRIFAAMLANLDDSVGAILQKLQDEQLEKRTLVVFLSDNGGPTRELTSSNAPLRGGKGSMYEGGLRVPFLMRWPGVLPQARVEDRMIASTDLFATAAALAGAQSAPALDSVNLLPHLTGENPAPPRQSFFWRQGPSTALRDGDWKIVRHRGDDWELYKIAEDRSESRDLARENPKKVADLRQQWESLNRQMRAPLFGGN